MDLRALGVAVLSVTCIRPCLQCRCHGVDLGHVDCGGGRLVFGFAGDGVTSPFALFVGHVCQHQFDAVFWDGLKAYRPLV